MENYLVCKNIKDIVARYAGTAFLYDTWTDEISGDHIKKVPEIIKDADWYKPVDPSKFSKEELKELGFALWDKESNLYLIPTWLAPFLVDKFMGSAIDETTVYELTTSVMDLDQRMGYIAYGVVPESSAEYMTPQTTVIRAEEDVTADQIKYSILNNKIDIVYVRPCSICDSPLSYKINNNKIYFDSSCSCCPPVEPTLMDWGDLASFINIQKDLGSREALMKQCGLEVIK